MHTYKYDMLQDELLIRFGLFSWEFYIRTVIGKEGYIMVPVHHGSENAKLKGSTHDHCLFPFITKSMCLKHISFWTICSSLKPCNQVWAHYIYLVDTQIWYEETHNENGIFTFFSIFSLEILKSCSIDQMAKSVFRAFISLLSYVNVFL